MVRQSILLIFAASGGAAFMPRAVPGRSRPSQLVLHESLGAGMWRQLTGGIFDSKETPQPEEGMISTTDVEAGRAAARSKKDVVAAIDARAQSGAVTFDDFLEMGRMFKATGGRMKGMPGKLTASQIEDTLAKFAIHEKIVKAMLDEERADPQLLMDDLKGIAESKAPRVQRLSKAAKVEEKDVAMFAAEFEAMRQSTQRIAAGEDPDAINAEIGASNRNARRAMKKAQKGGKIGKQFS